MSAGTRGNMTPTKKPDAEKRNAEREAALTFVRMAKEKGLDLTGPDGLPKQFTKSVLETALDEEMCFASMFVRQVRQCFSAVWADGFPRCRHRFPVM